MTKNGPDRSFHGFLEGPKDDDANSSANGESSQEDDDLFDDAVRLVFEFGKASTSLLQRRLRIGYGRAAHLIDMMEHDGLVGPADGSKPAKSSNPPTTTKKSTPHCANRPRRAGHAAFVDAGLPESPPPFSFGLGCPFPVVIRLRRLSLI